MIDFEIDGMISQLEIVMRGYNRKPIEIHRNQLCPCGSGEKFKKCHMDSGTKWDEGPFRFYDGSIMYENLNLYLNLLETMRSILLTLKNTNSINESLGLQLIDELYEAYDPAIQQLQRNAPCRKGCISCCFQDVVLEKIEARKILNSINKDVNNNIKRNMKEKKEREKIPLSSKTDVKNYRTNYSTPCPFLNIEKGECSIYQARPFRCRLHFVYTHPSLCNEKGKKIDRYSGPTYDLYMQDVIQFINQKVYGDVSKNHIYAQFYEETSTRGKLFRFVKRIGK
ncbi:SEC-C metal-binding domain-containing protein [Priestia megaterium]|uniref:SEC-C metal-binding domain-containing protein n=1 Tax=Priestia megaterium TaxID=1404 RepID=UPI0015E31DA6|nr:SEC-C metal-binding domain-containing protein [Priestia megaterium]